ncbi:hypothetical protein BJ322DRAFT_1114267 [Thelephora terrestris]|uniref:RING-type domain-containing protein n=1 Tax=Thelephora terrestris TaxID=56493 RepID=A0A9P6L1T7_9AGAM|nr:hypothetical protein BJ322DRAFT_1114267 [Thelephora terrestris]
MQNQAYIKQLQEDHKTLKKGFIQLHEKYAESTARVAALDKELDGCRKELNGCRDDCQQLRDRAVVTNYVDHALRKVCFPHYLWIYFLTCLQEVMDEVCEKLKCMICLDVYALPYSLDCRHVWCGPCLIEWFTSQGNTNCPGCRAESIGQPQRDFALSGILSMVYEAQGRNAPTNLSENFDPSLFAKIYAEKEE